LIETPAPIEVAVLTSAALTRNHTGNVERFKLKQILIDHRRAVVG
jgi:hypothetical protein